jgi:hypothetical protein
VPFVGHPRAHITGGELPSTAGGMLVRVFGLEGLVVRSEGMVVKVIYFQGPKCKKILPFSCDFPEIGKMCRSSRKIQKIVKPNLPVSL